MLILLGKSGHFGWKNNLASSRWFLCKRVLRGTSAGPTLSDVVPDVHLQLLHALVHLGRELLLFIAVDDGDT